MEATNIAAQVSELSYALDTFYFLICGALVMWMAAGFTMLESGLVRAKNTAEILTKNVGLYSIACIMYMLVGYSIMYPGDFEGGVFQSLANIGVLGKDDADVAAATSSQPTSRKRKSTDTRETKRGGSPSDAIDMTELDGKNGTKKKRPATAKNKAKKSSVATLSIFSSLAKQHKFSHKVLPKRSVQEAERESNRVLTDIFQLSSLRNLQPQAVRDALQLKSQMIVMATGGGK